MFVMKRIFRTKKNLSYICTSNVLKCNKSESSNETSTSGTGQQKKEAIKKSFDIEKKNKKLLAESVKKKISQPKSSFDNLKPALKSSARKIAEKLQDKKICSDLLNYIKEFEVMENDERIPTSYDHQRKWHKTTLGQSKDLESPKLPLRKKKAFQDYSYNLLNIFDKKIMQETKNQVKLKIWDELEAEELVYITKVAPYNYFQELIQWTNEGQLWHFPIDNDQGMEEEAKTSFTEHVFLEQHLEPWCPKRGPLRNFMSLVLIGLSKNPYLGVDKKKEHIEWFRNYFEDKKKLLQELGAMGPVKEIENQQDQA